jgi:hypothetical protein
MQWEFGNLVCGLALGRCRRKLWTICTTTSGVKRQFFYFIIKVLKGSVLCCYRDSLMRYVGATQASRVSYRPKLWTTNRFCNFLIVPLKAVMHQTFASQSDIRPTCCLYWSKNLLCGWPQGQKNMLFAHYFAPPGP